MKVTRPEESPQTRELQAGRARVAATVRNLPFPSGNALPSPGFAGRYSHVTEPNQEEATGCVCRATFPFSAGRKPCVTAGTWAATWAWWSHKTGALDLMAVGLTQGPWSTRLQASAREGDSFSSTSLWVGDFYLLVTIWTSDVTWCFGGETEVIARCDEETFQS